MNTLLWLAVIAYVVAIVLTTWRTWIVRTDGELDHDLFWRFCVGMLCAFAAGCVILSFVSS